MKLVVWMNQMRSLAQFKGMVLPLDVPWRVIARALEQHGVGNKQLIRRLKQQHEKRQRLSGPRTVACATGVISLGTAFSGLNATYVALVHHNGLKIESKFCIEKDAGLQSFSQAVLKIPKSCEKYGDIGEMDPQTLPYVDIFQFSPPCTDFSNAGRKAGSSGETAALYKPCVSYIAAKEPIIWIYENVASIKKQKRHKDYCEKMLKSFRRVAKSGYLVTDFCLNSSKHGTSLMSRDRYFVVGVKKSHLKNQALRFQIPPKNRPRKLSEFINFERVGTADDFPSDAVRLRNISHCLSQVGKPALTKTYFIDGFASPTRPYYRQGLLPCLTASRAQSGGHFIAGKLMRMTDVDEMVRFMNLHPYLSENWPDSEQLSARQFGHAIGNSIDALLLSKILGAALGMVDL